MQLLLEAGADVRTVSKDGVTPLQMAEEGGAAALVLSHAFDLAKKVCFSPC